MKNCVICQKNSSPQLQKFGSSGVVAVLMPRALRAMAIVTVTDPLLPSFQAHGDDVGLEIWHGPIYQLRPANGVSPLPDPAHCMCPQTHAVGQTHCAVTEVVSWVWPSMGPYCTRLNLVRGPRPSMLGQSTGPIWSAGRFTTLTM